MKQLEVTTTLMEGYRVLTYRYDANQYLGFKFHLLSEVGEPWKLAAKAMQRALLKPDEQVVQVELSTKPWFVDAIVKKPPAYPQPMRDAFDARALACHLTNTTMQD